MNVRVPKKGMICGRTTNSSTDGLCGLHKKVGSALRLLNRPTLSIAIFDSCTAEILPELSRNHVDANDMLSADLEFTKESKRVASRVSR